MIKSTVYLILILIISSCQSEKSQGQAKSQPRQKDPLPSGESQITEPAPDQRFTIGEVIRIKTGIIDETVLVDSVEFFITGSKVASIADEPFEYQLRTNDFPAGILNIRSRTCYENGAKESNQLSAILLSDIKPRNFPYTVTNTYPHDIKAYTQGLIYLDGYLYEGTGQWNESSLRKVELLTGIPERTLNLSGDIFGEGITIFNGKIYQLTYKSQLGFVYDKNSFERLQKVYYQNKEGWGLTHNGKELIMSDGSHYLYFMDPEYFTEIRRIEVYDDKGPVNMLNELEYIKGMIFANIYGTERIVIIDPAKGKVTGILNMTGILPEADRHKRMDVFNGIAWDAATDRIFVTGKYWPKLFEIRLNTAL